MEVMGQETNKAYNTIHYGNPHKENQGIYVLDEGNFADEYHTFSLEWLPEELIWYIDGVETFRTSDWYTATEGQEKAAYPAPFDQPFHVTLNLAVGGSWVTYPDDTAFVSDNYSIDYEYGTEEIFDFMHDFRVAKVSGRKYINLTRNSSFIKDLSDRTGLLLTSYFLGTEDINKMLSHRF